VKNKKQVARRRRKYSIRKKISGTPDRPRLSIFRSTNHIYAQLIDDISGKTLASASTMSKDLQVKLKGSSIHGGNIEAATKVGELLAEKAKEVGVTKTVVDRNGYLFHGRVKALAFAAKNNGLTF
jgi:large subunit ribosomal protein L18